MVTHNAGYASLQKSIIYLTKLETTVSEHDNGCEIKRFKRSNSNDIIITDFTSIRKKTLEFKKSVAPLQFTLV